VDRRRISTISIVIAGIAGYQFIDSMWQYGASVGS